MPEFWESGLLGHIRNFKLVYQAIPEVEEDLARIRDRAQEVIEKARETVTDSVDVVDKLLSGAEAWNPGPDDHEDACQRCLEMKAPAVQKNRSSVGDCLIWRSVISLLHDHCVWFCSANKSDFSDPKKHDDLHPDLVSEASGGPHTLHYFSDPSVLVEELRKIHHAPPPAVPLPRYYDHVASAPTRCPGCNAEGTFTSGSYLRSQYGGLTWQYVCTSCGFRFDTGDFWD